MERLTTKDALETTWSIDDVADANETLDAWHEAEAAANKRE